MSLKNLKPEIAWAIASGLCVVLGFTPFHVAPLLLGHTFCLILVGLLARNAKTAFWAGFVVSFLMNALGFFWMVYTIKVFGDLPYPVAGLIFLIFCGFGALNLPLFTCFTHYFSQRYRWDKLSPAWRGFWITVALPSAYVVIEWLIPKLFPVYLGHGWYWLTLLTQISELTGAIFLSFLAMSLGGSLLLLYLLRKRQLAVSWSFVALPWGLLLGTLIFGTVRIAERPPESRLLRVALIQANIGSLEKVEARKGYYPKVRYVIDQYKELTVEAVKSGRKPDLVLWPETAMPMQMDRPSPFVNEIYTFAKELKVALLTGGYASQDTEAAGEYNAAFLIVPSEDGPGPAANALAASQNTRTEIYRKNILLAFGEYFPFGDIFPSLYQLFPQVANFGRGTQQNFFTLNNGVRLGLTICYEAIVPEFFRKTVQPGIHAVVNLTNDSWFGPTTEPRHHGALATFRSVESRLPLFRVTNTGISFFVDRYGRMSEATGVYEKAFLVKDVDVPIQLPPLTLYLRWGEWFVGLCAAITLLSVLCLRRKTRVSLSA